MIPDYVQRGDYEPLDRLIDLALREDIGPGDVTTQAIYSGTEHARASVLAKQDGIIAGLAVAERVLRRVDQTLVFTPSVQDGQRAANRQSIGEIQGKAGSILTAERTLLNFIQRMSGIATMVHGYVEAVAHTSARILDTRKTLPGHRVTDKWAVLLGGGVNHRIGLYDRYLIKENHIAVAGGIDQAIRACLVHRNTLARTVEIELEVTSLTELEQALVHHKHIDYIMLDNMSVDAMKTAVAMTGGRCRLEASGNVTIDTVRTIAETGVDFISIGAITHSVPAMDISLLFS